MSNNGTDLASNEILVAEGTEFERKMTLTLPRGRFARGKTPRIIQSISGLDLISGSDGLTVRNMGEALEHLFKTKGFIKELFPLSLGLTNRKTGVVSSEDKEWIEEDLTDMEIFYAYIEAASYITSNGESVSQEEMEAASKKSTPGVKSKDD